MTEIEEKKEYLKSYERAVRQMERRAERIKEMRLGQIIPSTDNDGMPHAHNAADMSGYVALLDAEERKYLKARYRCVRLCKEITDKIERMSQDNEKDILLYRYIQRMSWEQIAVKMNYSWQWVHKIHAKALHDFKIGD